MQGRFNNENRNSTICRMLSFNNQNMYNPEIWDLIDLTTIAPNDPNFGVYFLAYSKIGYVKLEMLAGARERENKRQDKGD